jgi:hypothetical protein
MKSSKAYEKLEKILDAIDASVFNGDLLYEDELRVLLKYYVERWDNAIIDHEVLPE